MPPSIFDHVKNNVSVSDYVRTLPSLKGLHSAGHKKWRCNNVIAEGSNPNAMMIDDELGFFKVFSHGQESGDVITLYSIMNNMTGENQKDCAIGLAELMGVDIDESMLGGSQGVSSASLTTVMDDIADKAHKFLLGSKTKDAVKVRKYLSSRGMSSGEVKKWRLGFLPTGQDNILDEYDRKTLKELGLVNDKGFSAMPGRLVFPIMSPRGKAISLSSRVVEGVDTALPDSKYVNTTNTQIYTKSDALYGQHLLKRSTQRVIVCEGNMDVIALNESLPKNWVGVATCGTALTEGHVSLLSRFGVLAVSIMFDSDSAGMESMSKLMWLSNHFSDVSYCPVPGGKDPWDAYQEGRSLEDAVHQGVNIISAAVSYKSDVLDRNSIIDWCGQQYQALNFSDDKALLVMEVSGAAGIPRRTLEKKVSGGTVKKTRQKTVGNTRLSDEVCFVISTLLGLDSNTRKKICYPFRMDDETRDYALDACGAETDDDVLALDVVATGDRTAVDKKLLSAVFSLAKDSPDFGACASYVARGLLHSWKTDGVPKSAREYISALNIIATGSSSADPVEQLAFVFDAVATY